MNRKAFRASFNSETSVVLPVIHVIDIEQTNRNIKIAIEGGCKGVFLINHDFGVEAFLPIIQMVRKANPDIWLGINFLAVTGKDAFPILAELENTGTRIDGYWADDARIDELSTIDDQHEAEDILKVKHSVNWQGLYFGGTAFKKQREVAPQNYAKSAEIACEYMDIVTTSGVATGKAADLAKIETFRNACNDKPIALASGITPDNVDSYGDLVDCLMVATGINIKDDFYNIDPQRLKSLFKKLES